MAELPNRQDFGDYGEWPGRAVLDAEGQGIGEVREIYLDQSTGRPEWVLVRTEGGDARFVPLAGSRVEGESLRVAFAHTQVTGAPDFGGDKRIDQDQERTLYDHYGIPYSESASDSGLPAPDAEVPSPPANADAEEPGADAGQAAAAGAAAGVPAVVADEEAGRADEDATGSVQAPADATGAPGGDETADASVVTADAPAADTATGGTVGSGLAGSGGSGTAEGTTENLDRAEAPEEPPELDGAQEPAELDRSDAREDLAAALSEDDAVALSAQPSATAAEPVPPTAESAVGTVESSWTPPPSDAGVDWTTPQPTGIKAAAGSRPVQLAGAGVGALLLILLVRRLRS